MGFFVLFFLWLDQRKDLTSYRNRRRTDSRVRDKKKQKKRNNIRRDNSRCFIVDSKTKRRNGNRSKKKEQDDEGCDVGWCWMWMIWGNKMREHCRGWSETKLIQKKKNVISVALCFFLCVLRMRFHSVLLSAVSLTGLWAGLLSCVVVTATISAYSVSSLAGEVGLAAPAPLAAPSSGAFSSSSA